MVQLLFGNLRLYDLKRELWLTFLSVMTDYDEVAHLLWGGVFAFLLIMREVEPIVSFISTSVNIRWSKEGLMSCCCAFKINNEEQV